MKEDDIFDIIKFDEKSLVTVIAQDFETNEVLMVAFANKEALKMTLETKFAHYFSRSRQKLWKKGETSGQTQEIKEILIDCDGDSLLLKVKQLGKPRAVSCHTGRKSCFFRNVNDDGSLKINQKILVTNEELYGL